MYVVGGINSLGFSNVPAAHTLGRGFVEKKRLYARTKVPVAKALGEPTLVVCSINKPRKI